MEHLPGDAVRGRGRAGLAGPVDAISQHGVSRGREVDSDLMGAPRLELDGDERRTRERLENAVPRHGALAPLARPRHRAPPEVAVAREGRVEDAGRRRCSFHDRDVLAFDLVALEALLQKSERLARPGEDQSPGGLAVEPVDDADVRPPAVPVLQVERDAREQRVLLALGRGHGEQSRGLLDDDQVGVLVEHGKARAHAVARRAAGMVRKVRAVGDLRPGLVLRHAPDVHAAGADRLARGAAREPEAARDGEVEPHGCPSCARRGTRISTKNWGSPTRGSGPAPGP